MSEDDKVELGKFIAGMANSTSRNGLTICSNGTSKADLIGTDPLFSRPSGRPAGSRKFLTGKMVRTAVKVNIASASLPPIFFSNHSLRKEMYTHMRAAGCSIDDRRDRGNYAEGSNVVD